MKRNRTAPAIPLILALLAILLTASAALADSPVNSSLLRAAVTNANIEAHMQALQAIGPRVAGTPAYDQAADYVRSKLVAAGYSVRNQPFNFAFYQELAQPIVAQTAPGSVTYTWDTDFYTMDYSGSGDVTANVQAVDLLLPPVGGSTSGCEASDFAGFTAGKIALIQRGTCTFALKAQNAQAAGASAVIIFNEGNDPSRTALYYGTLGGTGITIPVLSASYDFGITLNNLIPQGLQLHVFTSTESGVRSTYNLIAETTTGRPDRTVVVGAHLDSVAAGPGVNDDGSGVAIQLEVAIQMSRLGIVPTNKVVFAFWSAEEEGLLGSSYYVSQLTDRDIKNTALNLDFDMLASNNYAILVYDGDGSATPFAGPNGSGNVEKIFLDYFGSQSLPTFPTAFDGRSDYAPFIAAGIPAGGIFAGADDIKTAEQQALYGGTAGILLDPYYHTAGDTLANINETALDRMSDAVADAVLQFAMTGSAVNGTGKSSSVPKSTMTYWGDRAQK